KELQKRLAETEKELREFLAARRPTASLQYMADKLLRRAVEDHNLYERYRQANPGDKKALEAYRAPLARMGLVAETGDGPLALKQVQPGGTAYEKMLVHRANAVLLDKHILPGVLTISTLTNFVDQRLTAPKVWRDLFRYDNKGHFLGWTRYGD